MAVEWHSGLPHLPCMHGIARVNAVVSNSCCYPTTIFLGTVAAAKNQLCLHLSNLSSHISTFSSPPISEPLLLVLPSHSLLLDSDSCANQRSRLTTPGPPCRAQSKGLLARFGTYTEVGGVSTEGLLGMGVGQCGSTPGRVAAAAWAALAVAGLSVWECGWHW